MDRILEALERHHNAVLAALAIVLGVFFVSLLMAGDWATAAGAFGNLIGASIGAAGAAGAVVWQLERQSRDRGKAIEDLRGAALRSVSLELARLVHWMETAVPLLIGGETRAAATKIYTGKMVGLQIESAWLQQLQSQSPGDIEALTSLREGTLQVWFVARQIAGAAKDSEGDRDDLAAAIHYLSRHIQEFAEQRLGGRQIGVSIAADAHQIVKTLDEVQLPKFYLPWMFRVV